MTIKRLVMLDFIGLKLSIGRLFHFFYRKFDDEPVLNERSSVYFIIILTSFCIQIVKFSSNCFTVQALASKLCKEFTHFLQALKEERCISNICRSIPRAWTCSNRNNKDYISLWCCRQKETSPSHASESKCSHDLYLLIKKRIRPKDAVPTMLGLSM